jgi:GTP diphosphokinase / guanosine-3',5'-bis(diphosphate) 3'-diphosphatase
MNIEATINYIKTAHSGQVDKCGVPYHLHPIAVMGLLPKNASEDMMKVALLHDVLEDTHLTPSNLIADGFSNEIIDAVILVSKFPDDRRTYMEWLRDIANSENEIAIQVKIADVTHNSDLSRAEGISVEDKKILMEMVNKRYSKALKILLEESEKQLHSYGPKTP